MLSRRLGVAVAVLDGYLYAVGGSDGSAPLNTVERCVCVPTHQCCQCVNCMHSLGLCVSGLSVLWHVGRCVTVHIGSEVQYAALPVWASLCAGIHGHIGFGGLTPPCSGDTVV